MRSYAGVPALPVVYLDLPGPLAGRFPRGDATLIAGPGGTGKGTALAWVAVATALQGHKVAMVLPEDDPETAVRPRLDAALRAIAGTDEPDFARDVLSRIYDLTTSEDGSPFTLDASGKSTGSLPALRAFVDEHSIRCVIVDPILSCLEGSIASNIGARRVISPLQQLAKESGAAVLLSHHTVGTGARQKVAGSTGLTDAARLVYMLTPDKFNASIRVLAVSKSNGPRPDAVRMTLREQPNGCPAAVWLDADELAARRTSWRTAKPLEKTIALHLLGAAPLSAVEAAIAAR